TGVHTCALPISPPYAGLRDLHHRFDDVQVLGFPCNQFGAQEPGTEAEICEFVETRYGVDFPMFAKVEVNGPGEAPLYSMLKAAQPGDGEQADITWNFEKFLVDGDGNVVQRFAPGTTPDEGGEVTAGRRGAAAAHAGPAAAGQPAAAGGERARGGQAATGTPTGAVRASRLVRATVRWPRNGRRSIPPISRVAPRTVAASESTPATGTTTWRASSRSTAGPRRATARGRRARPSSAASS